MWINKEQWENVTKRLAELERRHESHVQDVVTCRNFEVPTGRKIWTSPYGMSSWQVNETKRMLVKDVVQQILDHLGLKLTYTDGTPERVEVAKSKKAA